MRARLVCDLDLRGVPGGLVDLVRLASGALPDDVGIVVLGEAEA